MLTGIFGDALNTGLLVGFGGSGLREKSLDSIPLPFLDFEKHPEFV